MHEPVQAQLLHRPPRVSPGRLCILLLGLLIACGDDSGGGSTTAGPDGGSAATPDPCTDDARCDDGNFCNGAELCMPGAAGANEIGCMRSEEACLKTQVCDEDGQRCITVCDGDPDADGDGSDALECGGDDCDDSDGNRFPGNPEVCDKEDLDEDCDPTTFGDRDGDHDGFHDVACCNVTDDGLRLCGTDCDDDNDTAHPTAVEACDQVDNDCDVTVDEGVSVRGYYDGDYDLHGDPGMPLTACADTAMFAVVGDDCDDNNPGIHGAQPEFCDGLDNDCDGAVDEDASAVPWYLDNDGDSFGSPSSGMMESCEQPPGHFILGSDCNDENAEINPRRNEVCDGVDNDCDDSTDEGVQSDGFLDGDGDGYGPDGAQLVGCPGDEGFVLDGGDCNDDRATVHPGRLERCDDLDEDCDGEVDEGLRVVGYPDLDHDLHGDSSAPSQMVCGAGPGISLVNDDCDDGNPAVHALQPEICDEGSVDDPKTDNDCDGDIDEDSGDATWYADGDDDGFGDPHGDVLVACARPDGYALLPFDCDDSDGDVSPGADEVCDGIDNDCSGFANYRIGPGDLEDDDSDGYADVACALEPGGSGNDCDDLHPDVHPGADEVCDGIDNDCDGEVDENAEFLDWYVDLDRDSYGRQGPPSLSSCQPVAGYATRGGDCDDTDPGIKPGTTDSCDLVDQDCDGEFDEDAGRLRYYRDSDGDGHAGGQSLLTCIAPEGYTIVSSDCNDIDVSVHHGAAEQCNGVDDDCDGIVDEAISIAGFADADGDGHGDANTPVLACLGDGGFSLSAGDCDDGDLTVHPGAIEICDASDNDCDVTVDEDTDVADWYPDVDNDGFGDAGGSVLSSCDPQAGYSLLATDCDDSEPLSNPIRPEICDTEDNDCDGIADEGLEGLQPEVCDGLEDEDCDGVVDEGCQCVPNTARLCDGSDVGECRRGIQVCDGGGLWSDCLGGQDPGAECCDGLDNDCDGAVDNACISCSTCGDGNPEPGEACDNGINMGLYGGCEPGCQARGPYCGDGNTDDGFEACDDGNMTSNDGCEDDCTVTVDP